MRVGPQRALVPGLLLVAGGLALFSQVSAQSTYLTTVLPAVLLIGAGVGVAFPSLMTLAMSGSTPSDAGLASGLVNTTAQVGGALGLAVLATLAATRTKDLLESHHSEAAALLGGYHLAFLIGVGLVLAAVVVALALLRPAHGHVPIPESDAHERPQLEPLAEAMGEPYASATQAS